jgi:hypothetical protein
LLELGDGRHAAPELLEGRVYARRHVFGLLHRQTLVDEPGKLEVAAASTAGLVQLEAVALGAALEDVGFVAKLELLLLRGQPVVPSSSIPKQQQQMSTTRQASGDMCTHTGVRPNTICGDFPLLALSRSSSTMSWVISTCMACSGADLASLRAMSLSGAPIRAASQAGSSAVAMVVLKVQLYSRERIEA